MGGIRTRRRVSIVALVLIDSSPTLGTIDKTNGDFVFLHQQPAQFNAPVANLKVMMVFATVK